MVTLATVTTTTSRGGSAVDVDARGGPGGTGYYLAEVEAEVDATVMEALRPRGGVQRVGLRLWIGRGGEPFSRVGGERIDSYLTGGWRVSMSLGNPVQSASFEVGVVNGTSPLGSQSITPGILSRGTPWDVLLAYRYGDDGEAEFPLMQYARADASERVDGGAITDRINLHDNGFGWRNEPVTVQLPAGHGLTYSQVVRKVAGAIFAIDPAPFLAVPNIQGDFQFRKEVNLLNQSPLAYLAEIGDLWGVYYGWDEYGRFTGYRYAPESERGPIRGVIDERDIVVAVNGSPESVTLRGMPAPPTQLCFEGTIQHVRQKLGRTSLELPSTSFARFAKKVARYQQTGGTANSPTYSDTGTEEVTVEEKRSESLAAIGMDQDTVVAIENAAKGYHNLSAARYTLEADMDLLPIVGVYVAEQSLGAQAVVWNVERYIPLSRSSQTREFDADNRLTRELHEQWAIHHRRKAIQQRASQADTWESVGGIAGTLCLGNGEGVTTSRASLQLVERRIVEYGASEDGYLTYKRTRTFKWDLANGWEYRYGDGRTSSDGEEQFRLVSDREDWWEMAPGREDVHHHRWQEVDGYGQLLPGDAPAGNELLRGFLQPAEVRDDLEPSRDDYDTDAEHALAVAASHHDMQVMHAELRDEAAIAELGRVLNERRATYELAQAPWQLLNCIKRIFEQGRGRTFSFTAPPNPLLQRGSWWHFRYRKPGMDVDHDGIIVDSTFEQRGGDGPLLQRLTAVLH